MKGRRWWVSNLVLLFVSFIIIFVPAEICCLLGRTWLSIAVIFSSNKKRLPCHKNNIYMHIGFSLLTSEHHSYHITQTSYRALVSHSEGQSLPATRLLSELGGRNMCSVMMTSTSHCCVLTYQGKYRHEHHTLSYMCTPSMTSNGHLFIYLLLFFFLTNMTCPYHTRLNWSSVEGINHKRQLADYKLTPSSPITLAHTSTTGLWLHRLYIS